MKIEIEDRVKQLNALVSPRRDRHKPIYNWLSFKQSYSKELVDLVINEFQLKKGSFVLDPFCGSGTTLLTCKDMQMNAFGYDILPFCVFLSNAKTRNYDIDSLCAAYKKLEKLYLDISPMNSLSNVPFEKNPFHPGVERELLKLRQCIEMVRHPEIQDFFRLALLSILESVSNTIKAGGFLRFTERKIMPQDIRNIFFERAKSMINDVIGAREKRPSSDVQVKAFEADARNLPILRKYDCVITSPPYPNRHDYTRIYSLEMLLGLNFSGEQLKNLRYQTIRSHVEAKKRYDSKGFIVPKALSLIIKELKARSINNNQLPKMLVGYFEDMFLVMRGIAKAMKSGGKIALVVSNVRFAGINVPVDTILSEIGAQTGLKAKKIWIARYRGNSPQQMDRFQRKPSRESIIIMQR